MKRAAILAGLLLTVASCASQSGEGPKAAPTAKNTPVFNVRDYGAAGDGKTKDTAAFQKALDACGESGGTVVVPAGDYVVGSIVLHSNTTLKLERDAKIAGSPDADDYPVIKVRWEGKWRAGHRALVYAEKAKHIAIVGPGLIEGSGPLGNLRNPRGPSLIEPVECSDVLLDGFSTQYRRMWSIHLTCSNDIVCRNLHIRSDPRTGNGDGIDVDSCQNVTISKCDIDTGDDAIALKSGRGTEGVEAKRPTKNVIISDCRLGSWFAGLAMGSEQSGGIEDVTVRRCSFTRGANGIYIKSRIGRGGVIQNIDCRDLTAEGPRCFLRMNLVKSGIQDEQPVRGMAGVPEAKNLVFENIHSTCDTFMDAMLIPPQKPIQGLRVAHVTGTCKHGISLASARGVDVEDIELKGYERPLMRVYDVTGKRMQDVMEVPAATQPSVLP